MNRSRRQVLELGCGSLAGAVLGTSAQPTLGLIFPPLNRPVPEEALIMYPSGVRFIVAGLGLETMTPAGYESVIDRIAPAAQKLANEGATGIALLGTSLSFYKGSKFNERLTDSIKQATNLPAVTMSTAIVEGLRAVRARRLAVATAYNDEVNSLLESFLKESGFQVLAIKGMGIERIGSAGKVNQQTLQRFSAEVFQLAPRADAILVSCGGFRTLEMIAPLEQQCKVPVVSSTPHALWAGVRLLGLHGRAPGYGTLLSQG